MGSGGQGCTMWSVLVLGQERETLTIEGAKLLSSSSPTHSSSRLAQRLRYGFSAMLNQFLSGTKHLLIRAFTLGSSFSAQMQNEGPTGLRQATRILGRPRMLPLCLTRHCAQEEHEINKAMYGRPPPAAVRSLARHNQPCVQILLLGYSFLPPPLAGSMGDREIFEN